jgi:hypothetical protein
MLSRLSANRIWPDVPNTRHLLWKNIRDSRLIDERARLISSSVRVSCEAFRDSRMQGATSKIVVLVLQSGHVDMMALPTDRTDQYHFFSDVSTLIYRHRFRPIYTPSPSETELIRPILPLLENPHRKLIRQILVPHWIGMEVVSAIIQRIELARYLGVRQHLIEIHNSVEGPGFADELVNALSAICVSPKWD